MLTRIINAILTAWEAVTAFLTGLTAAKRRAVYQAAASAAVVAVVLGVTGQDTIDGLLTKLEAVLTALAACGSALALLHITPDQDDAGADLGDEDSGDDVASYEVLDDTM